MRLPTAHTTRTPIDLQTAMTPLIDVVFQLLIFFICASTGHVRELLLPTDLPSGSISGAGAVAAEKPLGEVWIRVTREEGETVFRVEAVEHRDMVQLEQTLRVLAETAREIPVILDVARDVPMGDMISVYDACRAVRFQSISIATSGVQRANE